MPSPTQKYGNTLNLALETPEEQRQQTRDLNAGFLPSSNSWEIIVRYNGNIDFLRNYNVSISYLIANYAILTVPQDFLSQLFTFDEIIYAELPKSLYFSIINGRRVSCIPAVQRTDFFMNSAPDGLFGAGMLCGIIDSGIDYANPVFRNPDGSTRILRLWDQTIPSSTPESELPGTIYTDTEINEALNAATPAQRFSLVPSRDTSGHGTHVAGIMAGNFAENPADNLGIATRSQLIVVKLNTTINNGFPRTTELMRGLDYLYRTALEFRRPISINLSFGNSYGPHDGTSLIEQFINDISKLWKMTICVGTGNEGASAGHAELLLSSGETKTIELSVGAFEPNLNIQIWKSYQDDISFQLELPGISQPVKLEPTIGKQEYLRGNQRILVYYGEPSPYSMNQEIYIEFIPAYDTIPYLTSGIWRIQSTGTKIASGRIDLWLPDASTLNRNTFFLLPSPEVTLTIPSTSEAVISVGAYDGNTLSYADFSGRGFTRRTNLVRPDLVAPGVNIASAAVGGGMEVRSGTSMATPFVAGSAALLMEYGILRGNDPYLYGEKVKAYLIKGAARLPGYSVYPNPLVGWGTLCLANSFPES